MSSKLKKQTGFTIVELLIVIVVIAVLATISIVAYTGIQQRARDSVRASDISQIKKALLAYDAIHGGIVRPGVTGYTRSVGEPFFGGWDASTHIGWLSFLRSGNGNMPTDPVNVTPNTTVTSPYTSGENRVYAYFCYDAGDPNGLPGSAAGVLVYRNESGAIVIDRVPVTSCLTVIPE